MSFSLSPQVTRYFPSGENLIEFAFPVRSSVYIFSNVFTLNTQTTPSDITAAKNYESEEKSMENTYLWPSSVNVLTLEKS
jgi:hypothetical protein